MLCISKNIPQQIKLAAKSSLIIFKLFGSFFLKTRRFVPHPVWHNFKAFSSFLVLISPKIPFFMAKALNRLFFHSIPLQEQFSYHSQRFAREAAIPNSLSHHHPGGIYAVQNPAKLDLDLSFRELIR